MIIETEIGKGKSKNILEGAINIAIEKAERYGTPLLIKREGKIKEVSPKQMKLILSRKKK